MLLSITTTHQPATDLGYLLGKHPERCQSFEPRTATRTSSTRRRMRSAAQRACCSTSTQSASYETIVVALTTRRSRVT